MKPLSVMMILGLAVSCSTLQELGTVFLSTQELLNRTNAALAAGHFSEASRWAQHLGDPALKVQWLKAVDDDRKATEGLKALETFSEGWSIDETDGRLTAVAALVNGLPDEIDKAPFEGRLQALVGQRDRSLAESVRQLQVLEDWEGLDALVKQLATLVPPFADRQGLAAWKALSQQRTAVARQAAADAKNLESQADSGATAAKGMDVGFDRVAAWGRARDQYAQALLLWKKVAAQGQSGAASDIKRVTGKMQGAQLAAEGEIRTEAQGFYAQLGTLFARMPEGGVPDTWTSADVTALLTESRARINDLMGQARSLADKYPDLLDQATLAKFDRQATVFLSRLDVAKRALDSPPVAKNQATAIPVMVGLFNPQTAHADRSRPAAFRGKTAEKPEWWWGLEDIPHGAYQDLVVTLGDSRKLGVWNRHIGVADPRPPADLVSADNRFGTAWPVLNAGPKFTGGVYHLEVMPDAKPAYQGDVTIYKSFLTRDR